MGGCSPNIENFELKKKKVGLIHVVAKCIHMKVISI